MRFIDVVLPLVDTDMTRGRGEGKISAALAARASPRLLGEGASRMIRVMISRAPTAMLAPFVERLWVSEGGEPKAARERVVPTGSMHIVVRLDPVPLRVFTSLDDAEGLCIEGPLVGGARDGFYLRDVSRPVSSVGAMLEPGASRALLGAPADVLASRHTPLSALWGADASRLVEMLVLAPTDEARLERFEAALLARLRASGFTRVDRRVRFAAEGMARGLRVAEVAEVLGKSPRRFGALFEAEVGLSPKRYARVLRVHETLTLATRRPDMSWTTIALARGYADQAHMTRELRAVAGVTPGAFRALAPLFPSHLPISP